MNEQIIDDFVDKFSSYIRKTPEGFYDTFRFTRTGLNLTHPRTWGYAVQALKDSGIHTIDIDIRINDRGKFQPDVIGRQEDGMEVLIIDYESPNSSDARIIEKDVNPYREWSEANNKETPYIIITTLPDKPGPEWELRYTSKGYYNEHHKGKLPEITKNPFRYWYDFYRKMLEGYNMDCIYFVNISGKDVNRVDIRGKNNKT